MTTLCSQCGAPNKPGARFCAGCGFALGAPDAARPTPANAPTAPLPVPWEMANGAPPAAAPPGSPAKTQRLAAATSALTPLGLGALLDHDRYVVIALLEQTPAGNRYLVRDRQFRRCPQCDAQQARTDGFCDACGAALTGDTHYLLLEAYDPAAFANLAALARQSFAHPNLVNVRGAFQAQAADRTPRAYLLKDPVVSGGAPAGTRAATRLVDQLAMAPAQALGWLDSVAALLDHAAEQSVLFADLPASSLLLSEGVLRVDAVEQAEAQDAARRPAIPARHCRHIAQLFPALTQAQSYPAPLAAALAELQATPPASAQSAVARLQAGLGVTPSAAHRPLSLSAGRLTDLGLVRQINEDSLVVLEFDRFYNSENAPLRLYAVADGMGGHAAGEVASKLALEKLTQALLAQTNMASAASPLAMLKQAGQDAARAVFEEARRTRSDMGTTLVAGLVDVAGRKLYAINVGDSRLYKLNVAAIRRISKDHSLVQRLIDSNQLTPEEARHHPNTNLIYRTLGERATVEIDTFEETIDVGDTLLLCSDGLCGLVDDLDLHRAISAAPTPQAACIRLIELAKVAGGHDNITAIVVAVLDATPPQEPPQ